MLKSILTGILAAGFSLILPAAPAYRDVFSEADRADNAMLQPFQKKEQKLYTFVPDAGSGPVRITAEGAALPPPWRGSYRTGDRKLFSGDRLELTFTGKAQPEEFLAELSGGQPLRWGKTEARPFSGTAVKQRETATLSLTVPKEWDGRWLRKLLIRTAAPITLHRLEIFRAPKNTRLDADRILAAPPRHQVKVTPFHGVPQITIDGVPFNGLGFGSFIHQQYGSYPDMLGKTGYRLAYFVVNLGEDILTKWNTPSWLGPDHFDFSAIDQQAEKLLNISPEVKIILQVQLDGAQWWTLAHPEDGGIHGREGVPDYQSEAWKRDCRDAVRQMVAHVQSSAYGANVIGYELFNGISMDCNFEVNDATPGALARFRAYLRERYGSEAALRKAWKDPGVTFGSATPETLPEYAARHPEWKAQLLADDPSKMARYFDSKRFRELTFQKTILDFARWIKEATHNRALAGARTGDFMANQWNLPAAGIEENDCNPVDLLLEAPEFDFFDIQPPYLGRHRLGTQGGGVPHLPVRSVALRNKLLVVQDDVPHLVKPAPDRRTLLEMKRLVNCYSLFNGAYPYQFQMSHYRLNTPWLLEEDCRSLQIYEKAVGLDRGSVAETAIVLDLDYQRFLGMDREMRGPSRTAALLDHLKWTWNRAGIAYDLILLQDLPKARDYKLYIFANTFDGSPEKRRIVADAVRNSGKVALFLWADGYFGASRRGTEPMRGLCGIGIRASETPRSWAMTPSAALTEPVSELFPLGRLTDTAPGEVGAADWKYAPGFTVADRAATPLALFTDSSDVAAAVKKFPGWTSIYSASPIAAPALLRYAARSAGVFSYTDTEDLFYVNRSFIALHAMADGELTLRLPEAQPLYEIHTQQEYPAAKKFLLPAEKNRTRLYFRGTKTEWEALPASAPLVAPWREPDEFESRATFFKGRDGSGAMWQPQGKGFRFHVPWNGAPARLFVELADLNAVAGTIQVHDRRSDGVGVALARRNGAQLTVLERREIRPGTARRVEFAAPAEPGRYLLVFDANGNTRFDTADLHGFGITAANRTGVYPAP